MKKPLALIIEDEVKLSNIFDVSLKAAGFKTETILNGAEAFDSLQSRTDIPRLIVLDLHLPQVSGEELLTHIRANNAFDNTKVMIVTADQILGESIRKDADLLLLKPISIIQLQILAKRLIGE